MENKEIYKIYASPLLKVTKKKPNAYLRNIYVEVGVADVL